HVVLFGAPAAGKSSLLGALAQAAQTQQHSLNGRLIDLSHGLAELQHRLYDEEPQETSQEVVPYPAIFESLPANGSPAVHTKLVLVDSDGRVANDLLSCRRMLAPNSSEDCLAYQILQADALVLTIDASASQEQVDADFAAFCHFLRMLEE